MKTNRQSIYRNLPRKPGVYLFKDVNGAILYIGKANNLLNRVGSYFTGTNTDRPWIRVMIESVDSVETMVVDTETEALMLEATLIKQHMPRFNIKLTDDKAYPYIKVILSEPIPRFTVTRRQTSDKALYFGPYLSARSATYALEFLRRLYGIHISPRPLRPGRERACLSCQIGSFSCPLSGEVDDETYRRRVTSAIEFLQGKRKKLIGDLEQKMAEAAEREQYEVAAKFRDRLQAVRHVLSQQNVISTTQDDYDVVGLYQTQHSALVATLRIQEGRVTGQKAFQFNLRGDETAAEIIRNFLISIYVNFSSLPGLLVLPTHLEDETGITHLLTTLAGKKVEIRIAERGEKYQMLALAEKNARAKLETRLLKTDQAYTALIALQELLQLQTLPHRIEAVDISNLGTSEPVGATVCFTDGKPDKNEYRRYKIRMRHYKSTPSRGRGRHPDNFELSDSGVKNIRQAPNDFAMIREVVSRRFHDTDRPVPDLFVVDGGPEQLKFALQGLETAPLQPKIIISLAKKPDRIFLPNRKLPIPAPRGHKGLYLLSRIRDEVHRFGITFQRQRQAKKSLGTID